VEEEALAAFLNQGNLRDVVAWFMDHGANATFATSGGWTVLHSAAAMAKEKADVINYLLDKGAKVSSTKGGWLPIHYRFWDHVELFVSKGCDINARNDQGETLLDRIVAHSLSLDGDMFDTKWISSRIAELRALCARYGEELREQEFKSWLQARNNRNV